MAQFTDQDIERLARKRAGEKLGWYIHAAVYLLVNLALFALGTSFGRRPWTIFPAIGWGVALALHGISVFLLGTGSAFRENLVQRERERLQRQRGRASGR